MSFCRPLLSPVHIPKFPRQHIATRYSHVVLAAPARTSCIGPHTRLSGGALDRDKFRATTSPTTLVPPPDIPKRAFSNTVSTPDALEKRFTANEYKKLQLRDHATLSASSYLRVMADAVQCNNPKLAERVVTDVLEVYRGGDAERNNILRTILSKDISLLSRDIVLRMLQDVNASSPDGLQFFDTPALARVARKISEGSKIRDTDRPLLRLIFPLLLERIQTLHIPEGVNAINNHPPEIIYGSFIATHKLLCLSFDQHALDLFQALVKSAHIPSEALHSADSSSKDVKLIISAALIRACLRWNWRGLAAALMTDLLANNTSTPDKSIIDLNIDTIYGLLDTPTYNDIRACGHLIRRVHRHSPVPASVIEHFYNCAAAVKSAEVAAEAEYMYAFTRAPSMLEHHRYPPPQGLALTWLMYHLTSRSSQTHLSRTLAQEVVDDRLPIPLLSRADFIAQTANEGYGKIARILWERHAAGTEGGAITGNSALLLRMVKLFWNLHVRVEGEAQKCHEGRTSPMEAEELERRSEDAVQFVQRVIQAFKLHHAPLASAPHRVLTSLARACFIVGEYADGFQAFKHLLDRKETPDLYDANVALSAAARFNPKLGVKMLDRMTASGLCPDAVSYGTILHCAVLQSDREVVEDMIKLIRGLDNSRDSGKTLANIISAIMSFVKNASTDELRTTLTNILHMFDSFPEVRFGGSSSVAKSLVYAALRTQDGELAYQFWKRSLHRSAEWGDIEQRHLRHRIGLVIQASGQLRDRDKRAMLLQLKQAG
ncbi:hypothetical protein DXG03_003301 [Asterophora parasitica]|uniref:Pentatricopeptide repeat protein n=1 Tax=Asterophora parasitica TaxID=117018 RepID=A0A9P7GBK5_9AGAR|nr:hypothetical protein DXG03_003301 [Asterophora parasitica]